MAKKQRTKRATPVKTPKSPEVKYRRTLLSLAKRLERDIQKDIIPILTQFKAEYVNDAYASILAQTFNRLRNAYVNINTQAQFVANSFITEVNAANKRRFYSSMERAIGVNIQSIVQNEDLNDILVAKTQENVALIQSIPDEYLKKVETIVFEGTTQGSQPTSIIQQIRKAGKVSENKAKLIARDQSSKLNSVFNQQRQQNLGVEEYIWVTAEDDRVRPDHASKNGKTFRWDDPPKDTGHPGNDINCRCIAQPLIKI